MSAWAKQRSDQIKKLGEQKAPWYCFWYEPDGRRRKKSCGQGARGKRSAERLAAKIKAALLEGRYRREENVDWPDFVEAYLMHSAANNRASSIKESRRALKNVERILKPKRITSITPERIAEFIGKRREERGKKPGSIVSPATVNCDLRHLKSAMNVALEWGMIVAVPKIKLLKEPEKLPTFVSAADFAAIYDAAEIAKKPTEFPHPCAEWWRGLLVTAQLTGWRISELLSLKWADVDFDAGTAITRHRDNKGGRDEVVPLHPIVIEHIRDLRCFHPNVFPWEHHRRTLYVEFARIQDEAGIHLRCPDEGDPKHGECTPACHRYGFHDERRAFATFNAAAMPAKALQKLMRHKSAQTTNRYINMAGQLNPAVAAIHVPECLQRKA